MKLTGAVVCELFVSATSHGISELGKERAEKHCHKTKSQGRDESKKIIPKPKGRAGRSDGYSLIDAMGLSSRNVHYNVLCVRVSKFIGLKY